MTAGKGSSATGTTNSGRGGGRGGTHGLRDAQISGEQRKTGACADSAAVYHQRNPPIEEAETRLEMGKGQAPAIQGRDGAQRRPEGGTHQDRAQGSPDGQ